MSDEIEFFDVEPEDSWDAGDAVEELIENLSRRCTLLGEPRRLRDGATPAELLDEIDERLQRVRRRRDGLSYRERIRYEMTVDDVVFIRRRL